MKKENRSLSHLLLFTDACVKRKAELSTEKSCGKRTCEDQSSTNGMFLVEFLIHTRFCMRGDISSVLCLLKNAQSSVTKVERIALAHA